MPSAAKPSASKSSAVTPLAPAPMTLAHPFDVALAVRGRRKQLKLRQVEVARAAGVGREWLIALEHGKPTAEIGLVLRTFAALGIQFDVLMLRRPPAWTLPLTAAAEARRERLKAHRPPRRARPDITPPEDWPGRDRWEDG